MDEKDIAIKVDHLTIRYKSLKAFSIKQNFFRLHKNKRETFEALRDISFEVKEGEILGIIGKNGSGKSTLLRALANIFSPDEGTIDTFGHSVSLLSIGVGFQKQLSGRENIILSGMLLGFSEEEIRAKMNRIIKFADLGKFIDMPVSTYSSGMYSKLAFSITAILETDIILIDEVLSVGDRRFKKKSYRKMKELISDDKRTVVIVSHSIQALRDLCQRVLWIDDGNMIKIGKTDEVLDEYEAYMDAEE
ncbi:MAG: ABC transporter ATP-binding protein [Agathobacter sp.]